MSLGLRIKQGRLRRGLSQTALGAKADISPATIGKYEKELCLPDSAVLIRIARALHIELDFFLRPIKVTVIDPRYRKRTSLGKKKQNQLREHIRDWLERYLEAEELAPSIAEPEPHFAYPTGFPRTVGTGEEIEQAAIDLRHAWDLGVDPLDDVTGLLESKGIKVDIIDAPSDFDACTFMASNHGRISAIVTRQGIPGDRQRFNLAHELGHCLLRMQPDFDEKRACNRFAGAFLAPRPTILESLGERRQELALPELHTLKHRYGLSMQALVYRAQDLEVVSPTWAQGFSRSFRQKKWHIQEPGHPIQPEQPTRLRLLVLQALAADVISEKRAAELYGAPLTTVC